MDERTAGHLLALDVSIKALIALLPEKQHLTLHEELQHYGKKVEELYGATALPDAAIDHMWAHLNHLSGVLRPTDL